MYLTICDVKVSPIHVFLVLGRKLGFRELLSQLLLLLWSIGWITHHFLPKQAPSSSLLVLPFNLLIIQTRMVSVEDTLTLKSV